MSYPIHDDEETTRHSLPIFPTSDRTMSLGQGSLFDKKQEFNILEKLKQLRDNKVYCDVVLVVRGVKLEAHKNVLAAWSPYFATRLFPGRSDVFKDTILVNYDSSEVFADLLDFMYNGYVAPRETNFLQLLHLAVSFQIEMLKNYCEEFLRCNLHLGNFVSTYFLSRKYNLDSLEEYIVGFLQLNLSDAVKQGEFLSLTARKFNTLLSKGWMEQIKPEIKLFLIISWVGYDVQEREKFLVLLLGHIDWSSVANDFLLEISRTDNFFTSHESSLYLLLQTLYSAGIAIGPYTETFPTLRETHEHILNEVVDTSLLQIEVEPFYPATIVVLGRPGHKDQSINTLPCKELNKDPVDIRDASMNTDVNSEHFEKVREDELKYSTIIVDPYQQEQEELSVDHPNVEGTLTIEANTQNFDEVGQFIEAELKELNRKSLEQASKETVEASQTIEEEVEDLVPAQRAKSPRRRKAVRGGAGRRARKTKIIIKEEKVAEVSSQNKEKHDKAIENKENDETAENHVENDKSTKHHVENDLLGKTEQSDNDKTRSTRKSKRVVNYKIKLAKDTENEDSDGEEHLVNDTKQLALEQQENGKVVPSIPSDVEEDSNDSVTDKTYEPKQTDDTAEDDYETMKKTFQRFMNKGRKRKHELFTCTEPGCSYKTIVPGRLERHRDREHERAIDQKCNICLFTSKCVRTFNNHMKEHIPGPPFKCDEPRCTYSHEKISVLLQHRTVHSDERPYACFCGMRFKCSNTLLQHKKTHSGSKDWQCPECDSCFATKNTMLQHMVTHYDTRPYLCDECGFSTKFQSHLTAHKRIHAGDVFTCQFPNCQYSTPKRSTLKSHMKFHLRVRSHTCQECGKSFIERGHLIRHEKLHSGKKINCEECAYVTTRKDKLKDHINKHHSEEAILRKKEKEEAKLRAANEKHTQTPRSIASKPMVVKWDHGGYSIPPNEDPDGVYQGENSTVLVGDNYCVLRDQLTANEPIQAPLIHTIINDPSVTPHSQLSDMEQAGHLQHEAGSLQHEAGSLQHEASSIQHEPGSMQHEAMDMVNSPGMDHVHSSGVSSGLDVNSIHESHAYTTINTAVPISQQHTSEYGGLGAFMALF